MTSLPINLPPNCSVLVSVSDKVKQGQIIAERKSSQVGKILPIAKFLSISPKTTIKYLKKQMGDRIEKGETIAEKRSVLKGKKLISPFSGTIFKLEEETGELYIITQERQSSPSKGGGIFSPIAGTVTFCDNTKIVLETDKNAIYSQKGAGEKSQGELLLIDTEEEIDYNKIKNIVTGKIILGRKFDKAAIYKSIAMGANGIIGKDFEDLDFEEFEEKKITKPVLKVSEEDFTRLKKAKGSTIVLEPEKNLILL